MISLTEYTKEEENGMKAPFSAYLNGLRGGLKELIALLRQEASA